MPTKYAIVILDGAADEPQESLGGKTPLQAARTSGDGPNRARALGRPATSPTSSVPASDVADLESVRLRPLQYYTGRCAPLEAAAMGHSLG